MRPSVTFLKFLLRRLALSLVTLWPLSVIIFAAGQLLPGDVGRAVLGPLTQLRFLIFDVGATASLVLGVNLIADGLQAVSER
jgi:ABC-type dipeptide/oligopeptide/nickel transport system permease component